MSEKIMYFVSVLLAIWLLFSVVVMAGFIRLINDPEPFCRSYYNEKVENVIEE